MQLIEESKVINVKNNHILVKSRKGEKEKKDMIVLRKKRLLLTAYMILTCVFVCVYTVMSNKTKSTDVSLVSALPVSNKVIVIDAGHRCTR